MKGISEMSAISQWEVGGLWVIEMKGDGNKMDAERIFHSRRDSECTVLLQL